MAASVHSLSRWGENVNFPTQRLATDNFYGRKLSPTLLPSLLTGAKYASPLPPPQSRGSLQSVGESRAESVLLSICWIAEVMCHRWERTAGMLVGRSNLVSRLLLRSFSKVKRNRFEAVDTILYLMFVASINLGLLDTMFFLCILQGPMSYSLRKDKHTDVHARILLYSLWIALGASQPSSSTCCHGFRFRLWVKFMQRENLPSLWQVPWASSLWGQHQIQGQSVLSGPAAPASQQPGQRPLTMPQVPGNWAAEEPASSRCGQTMFRLMMNQMTGICPVPIFSCRGWSRNLGQSGSSGVCRGRVHWSQEGFQIGADSRFTSGRA